MVRSVASSRRRDAWVPLVCPAVEVGAGSTARVARDVLALDGSVLPAGVISVPMSRSERHLGGCCPYASTESTLFVCVSASASAPASPSSRAPGAVAAGTATFAALHDCHPFCDADGSSSR